MKKFCIFCGNAPESKNREHVFPQWLIKMTGNPNRSIYLGLKWASRDLEKREFSFSSFTLPACEKCNSKFSDLESKAKIIMEDICSHNAISAHQWDVFLDWIDKIRIGIWLGMIYLNGNYRGITPQFHINSRIASKDRFLIIYEAQEDGYNGVSWSCSESPIFQYMPSCFAIMINNFIFLNVSYDFLFSYQIGFPFPVNRKFRKEGGEFIVLDHGTKKCLFPLIQKKFKSGGTQLFQPIIPYNFIKCEDDFKFDFESYYNNDYVRSKCMNFENGRGLIFKRNRNNLSEYSCLPTKEWIPNQKFERGLLQYQVNILASEFLVDLYKKNVSFEELGEDEEKFFKEQQEYALKLHDVLINHYIEQQKLYY